MSYHQQTRFNVMKEKQGRYSLRVETELMDWIKAEAEANHRTIIGQITMMLEMARDEIESEEA